MTPPAALQLDFSAIPGPELERALGELSRTEGGTIVTRAWLSALRLGSLWASLSGRAAMDARSLALVLGAVLSERKARTETLVELVWTGGEAKTAYARSTANVVREMFEYAERHVLIAGYSFDHGASILEPLHARMRAKGLQVDLYLHVGRARAGVDVARHLEREIASFFASNWQFGPPHPVVYVAPRTTDPTLKESLHAKCVVADERLAVLGSANFTDRGQSRNIEVGARIHDPGFAQALVAQFRAATSVGVFCRFERAADAAKGDRDKGER